MLTISVCVPADERYKSLNTKNNKKQKSFCDNTDILLSLIGERNVSSHNEPNIVTTNSYFVYNMFPAFHGF